jgi:hypothetical protein
VKKNNKEKCTLRGHCTFFWLQNNIHKEVKKEPSYNTVIWLTPGVSRPIFAKNLLIFKGILENIRYTETLMYPPHPKTRPLPFLTLDREHPAMESLDDLLRDRKSE